MLSIDPQLLSTVMGGCKKQKAPPPQPQQTQVVNNQVTNNQIAMQPPPRRAPSVDVQVAHGGQPQPMDGGDSATS